ncbi:MAG: phenylacetate--CoA ligase family protein [Pseudomonadota bacterium]
MVAPTRPLRREILALVSQMTARDGWSRERLLAYQRDRLRETIAHAARHSPYYRQAIGAAARGPLRLQDLPVLTKARLMEEFDRIVTDPRLRRADVEQHIAGPQASTLLFGQYRTLATGGSTGERGVMVYGPRTQMLAAANAWRWMGVLGIRTDTRVLGIGAASSIHVSNRLFEALRGGRPDAPQLAVTMPLSEIVAGLNADRPEILITYPSLLRRLAEEQAAGRLRIAPRHFCSVAEMLTPDLRELVRATWAVPVLDSYGTTETGLMGAECPWNTGIHLAEDMLVVEIVDRDNRPVPPGVTGDRILVTLLFNRALPLVRYEISDMVTLADGTCPCGRPHRRLASIDGRREDVLSLPARGGGVTTVQGVRFRAALFRMPVVRQFRVAPLPGGLKIEVVLQPDVAQDDGTLTSIRQAVLAELDQVGAAPETLTIEAVDRIERTGTGAKETLITKTGISATKPAPARRQATTGPNRSGSA